MRWEELHLSNLSRDNPDGKKGSRKMSGIYGPGERLGHSCNAINGGNLLYVFGGIDKDGFRTNKVHVFDTGGYLKFHDFLRISIHAFAVLAFISFQFSRQRWIKTKVKGSILPSPRDNHTCTNVQDSLFVFGGSDGNNTLKDTHILDTTSNIWIQKSFSGKGPEAREGHSAALFGIRIFIFGGYRKSRHSNALYYNDLYILDTETLKWECAITSDTLPSARHGHTCSSWKNKMVVVGGEDASGCFLSDVHILDTDTLIWTELQTSGQILSPCIFHSTVALGKNLFVFGGYTKFQKPCDDLHTLNVDTGFWTKVMATGQVPSARFATAGDCVDPSKGVLLFLGGGNENRKALDDMYYLHTGISMENGQDEQRQEKYSPTSLPANDQAVSKIGTMAYLSKTIPPPSYGQAGSGDDFYAYHCCCVYVSVHTCMVVPQVGGWSKVLDKLMIRFGRGELTSASTGKSSLESMSNAEHIRNDSSAIISTPQVIMEVPKPVRSYRLVKVKIKKSKGKTDTNMDTNNEVPTSVSQPVSKGIDNGCHKDSGKGSPELVDLSADMFVGTSRKGFSDAKNKFLCTPNRKTKPKIHKVFLDTCDLNVKKLLSTGILEGAPVIYIPSSSKTEDRSKELHGVIRGCGYLCGCLLCNRSKVLSARKFEKHAGCKSEHPNNHIFVGNENSLFSIVKEIKSGSINSLEEVVKKAAGSSKLDEKGKQNLSLNDFGLPQGKVIEAKVTESFSHGCSIKAIVDGKALNGMLFYDQSSHSNSANGSHSRKRRDVDIDGFKLNDDHEPQLKTARPLRQKDEIRGKQSTSIIQLETVLASDTNNSVPVDVSQHHMVPENSDASIAPLLDPNNDGENDAPNPNTEAS
ncbi:hypothetical protein HHK36_024436 [Tetracentron sinense]|uniref:Tify domain-containing protein n=1 Tax=Tetracentron sinense TaxID=13715 RepID=A0A834YPV3_TETSI|nr:hypothetical protein HHK36_024436 [Tetracentron sinense]